MWEIAMQQVKNFSRIVVGLLMVGLLALVSIFIWEAANYKRPDDIQTPPPVSPDATKVLPTLAPETPTKSELGTPALTTPPVTPKPITYSITSTDSWLSFTSPEVGFSLKYPDPEIPPQVIAESGIISPAYRVVITIRTGPTMPASWTNIAVIEIGVHPNPSHLSLVEIVSTLSSQYGGIEPLNVDIDSNVILQNLSSGGAEEVKAFGAPGGSPIFYGASHGGRVYLFVAGLMTESEAQNQVFELLTSTIKFDK
jgi:hypothetical protein